MPRKKNKSSPNDYPGRIRIVAGKWRNRLLNVADVEGLRPTSERIRETLFNWLATNIIGTRCLDLYAGTGSLGFEALSRGAKLCTFIDQSESAIKLIKETANALNAENTYIFKRDAIKYLNPREPEVFDLVFLDPPFSENILNDTLRLLNDGNWISPGGLVYVEFESNHAFPDLPEGWTVSHKKNTGNVCFALIKVI